MPRFPKMEVDIIAQDDGINTGYMANPVDYPNADLPVRCTQTGVALETELQLTNQPRCDQPEYRVLVLNAGGNSVLSNTATMVL